MLVVALATVRASEVALERPPTERACEAPEWRQLHERLDEAYSLPDYHEVPLADVFQLIDYVGMQWYQARYQAWYLAWYLAWFRAWYQAGYQAWYQAW